jgi:Arc/MetJ-type ribon-helix-helix transcriptional regulator
MATDVTSIRLPLKDAIMLDHFVESGEFKSRSEFIRFAVKKAINEMILKEFHEKLGEDKKMTKKKLDKLQKEIKEIRQKLWEDYAKHLS